MDAPRGRVTFVLATLGSVAMMLAGLAMPAGAAPTGNGESCPSSVDTADEGWICELLLIHTPTDSPSESQIELWTDVLDNRGPLAVTDEIIFSEVSVVNKVRVLYRTQLHRNPETAGLDYWTEVFQNLKSELEVEFGVFRSGEYLSQFESVEAFVNDQYQYYLGRSATRDERAYWAGVFDQTSNEGITWAIGLSEEAGLVRADRLYRTHLHRTPESAGKAYWGDIAATGGYYATAVWFSSGNEARAKLGASGQAKAA